MKCRAVIIALSPSEKRVLGLTLLKRTILAAHQIGINHFFITSCGGESDEIHKLKQDRRLRQEGIDIQMESRDNHQNPPSTSENILVIPGNCVYFPSIIPKLMEEDLPEGGLRLLTDDDDNFSGIALCSPNILPSLLDLVKEEVGEIDLPIVKSLVPKELLSIKKIEADQWMTVSSKADYRRATAILLKSARKPEDGFVAKHFNRPISLATTRLLLTFNVTPTQVTIANLIIGLFSGYFIGKGGHLNSLLGGFFFQCASIFDGCDGEIARLTYQCSEFGTKFDNICDILTLIVFLVNLPIGIYSSTQNPLYLYLGILMLLSVASIYIQIQRFMKKTKFSGSLVKIVKDIQKKDQAPKPSFLDRAAAKIAFIFRNDFIKMIIFLMAALNGRIVILWALILLSPIESIYLNIYSRQTLESQKRGG